MKWTFQFSVAHRSSLLRCVLLRCIELPRQDKTRQDWTGLARQDDYNCDDDEEVACCLASQLEWNRS